VAAGIVTGDAMVKRAAVTVLRAGTVHPGKYLVLVAGPVAEVEEALAAGLESAEGELIDHVFLPHAHPDLSAALTRPPKGRAPGDALGILETCTVAPLLAAVDRALKGAAVQLTELRLADDLGGKAYALLAGEVTDVEAAFEAALDGLPAAARRAERIVPRLHDEMRTGLERGATLRSHLAEDA
jgi:microcompartment protein CcmL/EutN